MSRRKAENLVAQDSFKSPNTKSSTAKELVSAIRESGLIGMWKDRKDIKDSSEFARKLRKQASKRTIESDAITRHGCND